MTTKEAASNPGLFIDGAPGCLGKLGIHYFEFTIKKMKVFRKSL